jgi:hypothetical protein
MLREHIRLIGELKNAAHIQGGDLVSLYISGSHLYGWPSKNSDVDIRGMYMLRDREFLGLHPPKNYIRINYEDNSPENVEYDIDIFEIRKALNLAVKGNCNVLEGFAAEPIYKTVEYRELTKLIEGKWGKNGVYNSYRGMAWQNYRKFILNGRNTVKKYLYVFRALMAGTYALTTGRIEPNMEVLARYWRVEPVKELLKIKKNGLENEGTESLNTGELDLLVEKWLDKIDEAYENCKIPEKMSEDNIAIIDGWLKQGRN